MKSRPRDGNAEWAHAGRPQTLPSQQFTQNISDEDVGAIRRRMHGRLRASYSPQGWTVRHAGSLLHRSMSRLRAARHTNCERKRAEPKHRI
jgi:hypothetical protein